METIFGDIDDMNMDMDKTRVLSQTNYLDKVEGTEIIINSEEELSHGSFGSVVLVSEDANVNDSLYDYCNEKPEKCMVRKDMEVTIRNGRILDNEINVMSILASLPADFSKYFILLKGIERECKGMFYDEDDECVSTYQEYGGVTLEQYKFDNKIILYGDLLRIMAYIAKGISILHACGFCHYDLKPQNILVQVKDGKVMGVKIIDFGSTLFIRNGKAYILIKKGKTFDLKEYKKRPMMTAAYSAPETIFGCGKTCLTDIWSIGVIFTELITGVNILKVLFIPDHEKLSYEELLEKYVELSIAYPQLIQTNLQTYLEKKGELSLIQLVKTTLSAALSKNYPELDEPIVNKFSSAVASSFILCRSVPGCAKHEECFSDPGAEDLDRISARDMHRTIIEFITFQSKPQASPPPTQPTYTEVRPFDAS